MTEDVWIGLEDIKDEGNFAWIDGTQLDFTRLKYKQLYFKFNALFS